MRPPPHPNPIYLREATTPPRRARLYRPYEAADTHTCPPGSGAAEARTRTVPRNVDLTSLYAGLPLLVTGYKPRKPKHHSAHR